MQTQTGSACKKAWQQWPEKSKRGVYLSYVRLLLRKDFPTSDGSLGALAAQQ